MVACIIADKENTRNTAEWKTQIFSISKWKTKIPTAQVYPKQQTRVTASQLFWSLALPASLERQH